MNIKSREDFIKESNLNGFSDEELRDAERDASYIEDGGFNEKYDYERKEYMGKLMPIEFKDICVEFKNKVIKRKDPDTTIFRFYKKFQSFLTYTYKGSLPKDIISLARKLNYSDYLVDLFSLSEDKYKEKHQEEYNNFFYNKSDFDKKLIFQSSDYGARSVFELQQDVIASNILEDMIVRYSFGYLTPNNEATGRDEKSKITSKCDLIFKYNDIEVPVEVKTKWCRFLEKDEKIKIRNNSYNLTKSKGMILAIYLGLDNNVFKGVKGVLIDSVGNNIITKGKMTIVDKDSVDYHVSINNLIDFSFWDEKDMKNMINNIYHMYNDRKGEK